MLGKLSMYPLRAYVAFSGFVRGIRENEHGLSGVVVAVLLILIAVLAVVIIWGSLSGWLRELWDRIVGSADEIN